MAINSVNSSGTYPEPASQSQQSNLSDQSQLPESVQPTQQPTQPIDADSSLLQSSYISQTLNSILDASIDANTYAIRNVK